MERTDYNPKYPETCSTYDNADWSGYARPSIKFPVGDVIDERAWNQRWWFGLLKWGGEWQFGLGPIAIRWPFVRA